MTALPPIVSHEEWAAARDELLADEKSATRLLDRIAAKRRRLPMVRFTDHSFTGPGGPVTLRELFGEAPQLAVYQFMDNGPDHFCPGCTAFTDTVTDLDGLRRRGIAWATVSEMPIEQIETYKSQKGWTMPFVSSRGTSFVEECRLPGGFMLSMFLRDGDQVFRTYSTTARGVDRLLFVNAISDLAPYGRQEEWEESPVGWPQHPTYG